MSVTTISGAFVYQPPIGEPGAINHVGGCFDVVLVVLKDGMYFLEGDVSNLITLRGMKVRGMKGE